MKNYIYHQVNMQLFCRLKESYLSKHAMPGMGKIKMKAKGKDQGEKVSNSYKTTGY
jgi:hypothetical protein